MIKTTRMTFVIDTTLTHGELTGVAHALDAWAAGLSLPPGLAPTFSYRSMLNEGTQTVSVAFSELFVAAEFVIREVTEVMRKALAPRGPWQQLRRCAARTITMGLFAHRRAPLRHTITVVDAEADATPAATG